MRHKNKHGAGECRRYTWSGWSNDTNNKSTSTGLEIAIPNHGARLAIVLNGKGT